MAILECLQHGLPVAITEPCHFPAIINAGAGFIGEPGKEGTRALLSRIASCDYVTLRRMGECGAALVAREFGWHRIGRDMTAVYEWIRDKADKPSCVHI